MKEIPGQIAGPGQEARQVLGQLPHLTSSCCQVDPRDESLQYLPCAGLAFIM